MYSRRGKRSREYTYSQGRMMRSQAITSFGIGSVYELRMYSRERRTVPRSVMIAGLEWWKVENNKEIIRERTLERSLGVNYFVRPPAVEEDDEQSRDFIPAVRFPSWLVCNRCSRMGRVGREFDGRYSGGPVCNATNCNGRGVPARLIIACYPDDENESTEQPGHIDDFPWVWWAHSEREEGRCSNPQLKLESVGKTASLAGLVVSCHSSECQGDTKRSLSGVFGEKALPINCSGRRPWLYDREGGCERNVRALLRGSSSVYFPVTASAISIPPDSERLNQLLNDAKDLILSVGQVDMELLVQMARNNYRAVDERYTNEEIEKTLRYLAGEGEQEDVRVTEQEQRVRERRAIIRGRDEDEKAEEFVAEPVCLDDGDTILSEYLDDLVLVHKLREVRALRGFQRVIPTAGEDDSYGVPVAPLAREKTDWLPAIEVRGEGVYIEVNAQKMTVWGNRRKVKERVEILHKNIRRNASGDREPSLPGPRYILIHTLSHLLIKQLSLECGYSSASLRERLYVAVDDHAEAAGVLIYTAGTGSDGTLGGLVRQGEPDRLERMLTGAVEGALWCASDPLCMESEGQGVEARNLAACHACGLVSETSCENRNVDLDRALLVGTPGEKEIGFFSDLV